MVGFDDVADAADYTPPLTTRAAGLRRPRRARRRGSVARIEGRGTVAEAPPHGAPAILAPLLRDVVPTRLVRARSSGPAASVAS